MSREAHVPFCEGLLGKFQRSTLLSMSEDVCLIYNAHGAENLSCLHHMSLNMLGAEPTKISIVRKQKRCMMNPSMLKVVLKTGFSSSVTNKILMRWP